MKWLGRADSVKYSEMLAVWKNQQKKNLTMVVNSKGILLGQQQNMPIRYPGIVGVLEIISCLAEMTGSIRTWGNIGYQHLAKKSKSSDDNISLSIKAGSISAFYTALIIVPFTLPGN